MFDTKIRSGDEMFENALYRHAHVNVTGVSIDRDLNMDMIRIVFTIQNRERTKTICDIQQLRNDEVRYYRPENITFKANKIAKWINKIPDHIPEEQLVRWVECKI